MKSNGETTEPRFFEAMPFYNKMALGFLFLPSCADWLDSPWDLDQE